MKFFSLSDCAKVIKDYDVVLKKMASWKGKTKKKIVVYLEKSLFAKALMCEYFTPNDDDAIARNEGKTSFVPKYKFLFYVLFPWNLQRC